MPAESFLQKFHDLARGRGGNFKRVSSHFIFAVFLILAVYNEDIPPVKLIFPDGDFVRFPIEPGLGATGLAPFFWVFRARPPDKPDSTDQDCDD